MELLVSIYKKKSFNSHQYKGRREHIFHLPLSQQTYFYNLYKSVTVYIE